MEKLSILLGKTVQKVTRLRGNGGSALPGLVVERTNPNFIKHTLAKLPMGVVVVSGTNGKTTTTKIVSELLAKQGLKVFTNNTGSNFVRGVISAIIKNIKVSGRFDYDIAVLELDEAHAVKFSEGDSTFSMVYKSPTRPPHKGRRKRHMVKIHFFIIIIFLLQSSSSIGEQEYSL